MKEERILYMDYSSPLQRMGVVAFVQGQGNFRPTLKEASWYWLSRYLRGTVTPEDEKIKDEYGNR
jgi:hypothetical protein